MRKKTSQFLAIFSDISGVLVCWGILWVPCFLFCFVIWVYFLVKQNRLLEWETHLNQLLEMWVTACSKLSPRLTKSDFLSCSLSQGCPEQCFKTSSILKKDFILLLLFPLLSNKEVVDSFLEKRNIQYFEEVLEYRTVPSVLFNSYTASLNYQEMELWGQNRLLYFTPLLQWYGFGVLSFFFHQQKRKLICIFSR